MVAILGVTTGSDRGGGSNATVDGVDGAERVDVDLEVSEGLIRARLEGDCIAARSRIESVNGGEDGVGILA